MGQKIESFRDLRVYQLAFELQQNVFELSKSFPPEEKYSLTSQIRRSSRSVGANITEAWQKRRYPAHFVSKLSDSDGEQAETQHWLETASACQYISATKKLELATQYMDVGRMLGRMMEEPEKWCRQFRK